MLVGREQLNRRGGKTAFEKSERGKTWRVSMTSQQTAIQGEAEIPI